MLYTYKESTETWGGWEAVDPVSVEAATVMN